jgi:hypothetical protein
MVVSVSWLDSVLAFLSRLLGGPQPFTDQPLTDFGRGRDEGVEDHGRKATSAGGIATSTRKRVGKLTLKDLDACAYWEFAADELHLKGQDEETVRPRPDWQVADPANGLAIVSAHFNAKDGTRYRGYYYVAPEDGLASRQPTVVTDAGQVNFWLGMFPRQSAVDAYLLKLGTTRERLFPLSFEGDLPAANHKRAGKITSFRKWSGKPDGEAVR